MIPSTHRGTRSLYSQSLREAEKIVSEHAHYDKRQAESTNRLDGYEVIVEVTKRLGFCHPDVAYLYVSGLILQDSRGRGFTQKIVITPEWGWTR